MYITCVGCVLYTIMWNIWTRKKQLMEFNAFFQRVIFVCSTWYLCVTSEGNSLNWENPRIRMLLFCMKLVKGCL